MPIFFKKSSSVILEFHLVFYILFSNFLFFLSKIQIYEQLLGIWAYLNIFYKI
jgi:hypothetical protein